MKNPLTADVLRNVFNPALVKNLLRGKSEIKEIMIGQGRAVKALKFGVSISDSGFNIFVAGEAGTGKLTAVKSFVGEPAKKQPVPPDWCYVNNFRDPFQPKKLSLPPGRAIELRNDMDDLIREARQVLIRTFESEEYASRRKKILEKLEQDQEAVYGPINREAEKKSLLIKQTPWEIFTVPLKDGKPMTDEQFDNLSEKEQEEIRETQRKFSEEIKSGIQQVRKLEKAANEELSKLEKDVAANAINNVIEETKEKYQSLGEVLNYLSEVRDDILDNLPEFLTQRRQDAAIQLTPKRGADMIRYKVNVLVDNSKQQGAPVVFEQNPSLNNLFGRSEKESYMGSLFTDFTLIRKGSLHTANGGYLILRIEELLRNYFSYDSLKRALRNKEIVIEEPGEQLGFLTTRTLKPEPIPLSIKVILIGSPIYYYLLYQLDPDFRELFKVKADFDNTMDRTETNLGDYVAFALGLCEREKLASPDDEAISKIIEHGSRLADDQQKLSTRFGELADLLREANHYASEENSKNISSAHINKAVEEKVYRSNLIQEKIDEMIINKQLVIDITGEKVGQINGLSVIDLGDISFGRPMRITCSVNLGKEGIIAIEREAELSGPIHTKGVLILTGYLSEKFIQEIPVSLSARIVFEQSYSEVEGDSASSAELYSILSNLSGLPIRQGIAVTGSVNQKGEVQAIGGVNEKIEGYFEVCKKIGLNGEQGVIIPSSNLRNLMLKEEVVQAVKENKFRIWEVKTIDEGIEILTGKKYGATAEEGTIAFLVMQSLKKYAEKMKAFVKDEEVKKN